MRNPNWTRDEVILAMDYYFRYREQEGVLRKSFPAMLELSDTLNRSADTRQIERTSTFRNINGLT